MCKHCSPELAISPNLDTTHLNQHIKDACKQINKEERKRFPLDKGDDLFQSSSFKFDPELIRNLMTMFFIDAKIAFSVIESMFWEPAMKLLRPEYKVVRC